MRNQLSVLARRAKLALLAIVMALPVVGFGTVATATPAHAWNTYSQSCSTSAYSTWTGVNTQVCFDLTATWEGSYWQYRESGWTTDGSTPGFFHFQLQDWICGSYDPPDYYHTSGSEVQWDAIYEDINTGGCGPQLASGNSYFTSNYMATRGVSQFSVWN